MIKDLAELKRLLALCRKQGVKEIKFGETSIVFGDAPTRKQGEVADDEGEEIPSDEPTPEQLMFFSAGGVPP